MLRNALILVTCEFLTYIEPVTSLFMDRFIVSFLSSIFGLNIYK